MWAAWLQSFPSLDALPLDVGPGGQDRRLGTPLPWLAERFIANDERSIYDALEALALGRPADCSSIARRAMDAGYRHPDLRLLAAMCLMSEGRIAEALPLLEELSSHHQSGDKPIAGTVIRHLYPGLRCLLRICPTQLLPLYPSPYLIGMLLAVCLEALGRQEEALETLRQMVPEFGLHDEMRIMAARIHIHLGNLAQAEQSLTHSECLEQDALEFMRGFYLAYCYYLAGQFRRAALELGRILRTMLHVNEFSANRARLLYAECLAAAGLLLDALRESGSVDPRWLPRDIALEVLRREEDWLAQLQALAPNELERLAEANLYQVYLPEQKASKGLVSKLDVSRDPLNNIRAQTLSWAGQRRHEQELSEARAAVARGEAVPILVKPKLSAAGADVLRRIETAVEWFHDRRQALLAANGGTELARYDLASEPALRFDFRGTRVQDYMPLQAEVKAWQALRAVAVVVGLGATLAIIRGCFGQ